MATMRYVGNQTFEPSLGVTSDGAIYFSMTPPPGAIIGFGSAVYRSTDQGLTWQDVSPRVGDRRIPPETNDPLIYVDDITGRVFQFAMAPILTCSILSWSDDGGATWTTNPRGCGNPGVWDHQAMVAAKPRVLATVGYANVLVQCVNQISHAVCARSLDGGLSWSPGAVAYTNPYAATTTYAGLDLVGDSCPGSSVHGHPKAAPDGTIYLPSNLCGHEAIVAISRDDGSTWTTVKVSDVGPAAADPTVAVDAAGNVYYAFTDDVGALRLATSRDAGATWSDAVVVSPPGVTTNVPSLAAGAEGRIVLAYPGTDDLPGGFQNELYRSRNSTFLRTLLWDGYFTLSIDAISASPTFTTVAINPSNDPLVRGACGPGRCPGFTDFMDVQIGPDGRPYGAFVDICKGTCVTRTTMSAGTLGEAVLGTLTSGPLLR